MNTNYFPMHYFKIKMNAQTLIENIGIYQVSGRGVASCVGAEGELCSSVSSSERYWGTLCSPNTEVTEILQEKLKSRCVKTHHMI